jgi:hypothetical protein
VGQLVEVRVLSTAPFPEAFSGAGYVALKRGATSSPLIIAAYCGARMGEVAVLTKVDCQQRDGVPVIVSSEAEGGTLNPLSPAWCLSMPNW